MSKLMTDHDEIRAWVSARAGNPAFISVPDGHGGDKTELQLVFGQGIFSTDHDESRDQLGGVELVSWADWFKTFEEKNMAIRVSDQSDNRDDSAYHFEKRS